MQYPAQRAVVLSTFVARFVDGAEQRYREYASPLRRWVIALDLLDEKELATMEDFFLARQGASGSFQFTDPWDGAIYTNCSIENGEQALEYLREGRGRVSVVVRENRG